MKEFTNQKHLFEKSFQYALDYLSNIRSRSLYPEKDAIENLKQFNESLPKNPTAGIEVLEQLHQYGSPATISYNHGCYHGFVNGGTIPEVLPIKWLIDVWDQNAALFAMSPLTSKIEEVCEKWLVELLGLPESTVAGFVSGSSMATLCGLACGRYALYKKMGWDFENMGFYGAPSLKIVTSSQTHATVLKAAQMLGIGQKQIYLVPCKSNGEIDETQLPKIDDRTIISLQAGNVNSGAFDHFEFICKIAQKNQAWVHIDGAFGLWAKISDKTKHLAKSIELADSWSVDAHKTLNTPYDNAVILCRDGQILNDALKASGSYIQYSENRDGMRFVPEMSRRSRALELWATMKVLGQSGMSKLIEHLCDCAQMFAQRIEQQDFYVLNDVVFNQVLIGYRGEKDLKAIVKSIQQGGECWCGTTLWNNQPAIRVSFSNWATTKQDIDITVNAFFKAEREN